MSLATNAGPFKLIEVELTGLGIKPTRFLHISDIHFAPGQRNKAAFLKELAALKPDIVVNTGDNLGHKDSVSPFLVAIEPLLDFPGVFVNGSNDYRSPKPKNPLSYLSGPSKVTSERNDLDTKRMTGEFEGAGWLNLNNQSGSLSVAGNKLDFVGVDDPHENLDNLAALEKLPGFTIGVAHAPYRRVIDGFLELGADLMFAGHTHGGQVCLPGSKAIITNCDLPREHAQGVSAWTLGSQNAYLHVSGGIGASIYSPIRVFCPPSATLLTIS